MKHLKLYEDFTNNNIDVIKHDVDDILDAYLEAAIWSSGDGEFDEYTIFDFADEDKDKAREDITKFLAQVGSMLDETDDEQIGHDFWLSRNGHGTGFFDRDYYDKVTADKLQDIASSFKGKNVELGDDEKLHIY